MIPNDFRLLTKVSHFNQNLYSSLLFVTHLFSSVTHFPIQHACRLYQQNPKPIPAGPDPRIPRQRLTHVFLIMKQATRATECEYRLDLIQNLKQSQLSTLPNASMIDTQPEIKWMMRPYLLDFLIDTHLTLNLAPATLFLAVNLVDRYLLFVALSPWNITSSLVALPCGLRPSRKIKSLESLSWKNSWNRFPAVLMKNQCFSKWKAISSTPLNGPSAMPQSSRSFNSFSVPSATQHWLLLPNTWPRSPCTIATFLLSLLQQLLLVAWLWLPILWLL